MLEFLGKNVLEINLKRMVYPLYLMRAALLSSNYNINGNVIKPVKIKSCVAVFSLIAALFIYYVISYVCSCNYDDKINGEKKTLFVFLFALYSF